MHINEEKANHLTKKNFDFKINKRRKDFIIKFKNYLIYKIKYIDYSNLIINFHYKYSNHDDLYSFFKTFYD